MVTLLKKWLGLIAMTLAAFALVACGGGSSSTPDTTPPSVSAFSVKNGAAINTASDTSYAVSGNVGTTQEYTITFSEKLDASSYSVKMLDSSNAQVALPTGMTATLTANDAGNLTYTLAIKTTNGTFVFDAGQSSKVVKLQVAVTDAASNTVKMNVTETVNHVDTAGVAAVTGPENSSGEAVLNLSASDVDGITTWEVSYIRVRTTGVQDSPAQWLSGSGSPPATVDFLMPWAVSSKAIIWITIKDTYGNKTTSQTIRIRRT